MAVSRRCLLPLLALMTLLLATGTVASPVGAAEEAVLIPGASPFKQIDPFYPMIARTYPLIGINLHDDDEPRVVDYSQNPFATERALKEGVERAATIVRDIQGKVVVIGESMGSMVAARLAEELAASSDPPSPDDIRFVLIASPEVGAAEYFKVGTYIPFLNYRVRRVPESPYPTTVVIGEYDPWADPPDRPWNLISSANAVMGMIYVHGPASWDVDLTDVPPENMTVRGTVTTYFVPTEHLPLTRPFRDIGVPDCVMDAVDGILRPIVDAGYRRHDQPGDSRPYLYDGRIRRDVQEAQTLEQSSEESAGDEEGEEDPGLQEEVGRDDRSRRGGVDEQEPTEDADEQVLSEDADEPEQTKDAEQEQTKDAEPESTSDPAESQAVGK